MIRADIVTKATRNRKYSCGFNFIERGRCLPSRWGKGGYFSG
jgi:hypothetical protein